MTDNRTTELQSLSKLKRAGRLRYWRGTIEMPESELHAICDEIQAEHDQAIAATLGSDASAVRLAERLRSTADEMRSVGASSMTPHELLACYANDVDKVADSLMFAATLGSGTCEIANARLRKSEAAKIERIEQLESLVRDMWHEMATCPDYATPPYRNCNICEQICNLGIEVGELVRCRDCMYLGVTPRRCMVCGHWDKCTKRSRAVIRGAKGR